MTSERTWNPELRHWCQPEPALRLPEACFANLWDFLLASRSLHSQAASPSPWSQARALNL